MISRSSRLPSVPYMGRYCKCHEPTKRPGLRCHGLLLYTKSKKEFVGRVPPPEPVAGRGHRRVHRSALVLSGRLLVGVDRAGVHGDDASGVDLGAVFGTGPAVEHDGLEPRALRVVVDDAGDEAVDGHV